MNLADEYRRQRAWRSWEQVLDALPPLEGRRVLDLGCGIGDQAEMLAARGARVIGIDLNAELIEVATGRGIPGAEFRVADLARLPDLGGAADGIWSSFAPAYFVDLAPVLEGWSRQLAPGGWIALTEVDDFLAHEPLDERSRELLAGFVEEARSSGRYDCRSGRGLATALERAGFTGIREWTVHDFELAFDGPALPEVVDAWRDRFARMRLLAEHCGAEHRHVVEAFLAALRHPRHRSIARVVVCLARK